MDHYNAIVKHKSAYYTFKLPITLGLMLANQFNEETHKNADDISMQLGRLFQMQVSRKIATESIDVGINFLIT